MTTGNGSAGQPWSGGWILRPLVGASLSQVVLGIMRPTVSYAGLQHGADAVGIGVLAASFAVLPIFIALPVGAWAGRLPRIGVVPFASALVLVIACGLAAIGDTLAVLIAASALLGVGNLGVLVGAQAWISRSAPSTRYNDGFGWMTAGMAAGQALGPLVAGVLVGPTGVSAAGIVLAFWASAGVAVLLSLTFVSRATRTYDGSVAPGPSRACEILRMPAVARYMLVSAAVLTSVDILTAYLPVLGTASGIAPVLIGAMLAVRGVASTLSRLLLGVLARRFDQSTLILASVVGTALCLLTISLVPAPAAMFAALAVGGFFLGIGQPLTMTAVAVALPAPARSSGLAMRLLGNRIAQTATPVLAGAATAVLGISAVFIVQVVALAASAAWELRARSARADPPDQTG